MIFLKFLLRVSIKVKKCRISANVCRVTLRWSACIHSSFCVAMLCGCISKWSGFQASRYLLLIAFIYLFTHRGAQNPTQGHPRRLRFLRRRIIFLVLIMKLPSCRHPGTHIFRAAPRFEENLCILFYECALWFRRDFAHVVWDKNQVHFVDLRNLALSSQLPHYVTEKCVMHSSRTQIFTGIFLCILTRNISSLTTVILFLFRPKLLQNT